MLKGVTAVTLLEIQRKKAFISWFLEAFKLKKPDAARILRLMLDSEPLLRRVQLVDSVRFLPTAVLISSQDAKTVSYLLKIDNRFFEDIDEFMEALAEAREEIIYLCLSFNREFACAFCPDKGMPQGRRRQEILRLIDGALDRRDRNEFMRLTGKLKELG